VGVHSAFVDRKGAATTRNEGSSGSAMPLRGIVLPLSKKLTESTSMLFPPLVHICSREAY